jgi:hypothetical protein
MSRSVTPLTRAARRAAICCAKGLPGPPGLPTAKRPPVARSWVVGTASAERVLLIGWTLASEWKRDSGSKARGWGAIGTFVHYITKWRALGGQSDEKAEETANAERKLLFEADGESIINRQLGAGHTCSAPGHTCSAPAIRVRHPGIRARRLAIRVRRRRYVFGAGQVRNKFGCTKSGAVTALPDMAHPPREPATERGVQPQSRAVLSFAGVRFFPRELAAEGAFSERGIHCR